MKKLILHIILILVTATLVTGCKNLPVKYKTASWIFDQMPKDAPENYKKGWQDGCQSGMANMTNSMYHTFYEFTQDSVLMKDPIYYRTWKDTYTFCRHYAYGVIRQGDDRMRLPNNTQTYHQFVGGGHDMLNHGMLNMQGPVRWGLMSEHAGPIAGDPFFKPGESLANFDYSDDAAMNGKGHGWGSGMTWDFTGWPYTYGFVPY